MTECWQAQPGDKDLLLLARIKEAYHPKLSEASIGIVYDACEKVKFKNVEAGVIDYGKVKMISSKSKPLTVNQNYPNGLDFVIEINCMPWSNLTPKQKEAQMDQWLCECSVKMVPKYEEIPAKKPGKPPKKGKPVRDEYGRIVYTDEIDRDENGRPKFTISKPDLVAFREVIDRHGIESFPADFCRSIKNFLDPKHTQ